MVFGERGLVGERVVGERESGGVGWKDGDRMEGWR